VLDSASFSAEEGTLSLAAPPDGPFDEAYFFLARLPVSSLGLFLLCLLRQVFPLRSAQRRGYVPSFTSLSIFLFFGIWQLR